MTKLCFLSISIFTLALSAAALAQSSSKDAWLQKWQTENKTWRVMHLGAPRPKTLADYERFITECLVPMDFNVLILEINYSFKFTSNPKLAGSGIDKQQARRLTRLCRENGIRLIPLFNCLGHQSWRDKTFALLKHYPQFDETPHIPANNKGIYCREWCPSHPGLAAVLYPLLDEIIEAFDADALHVGMDEVFLIGDKNCPHCKAKSPAKLFAGMVNQLYRYTKKEKGIDMLMWGDRLLDARQTGYGKWESSENSTASAIEMIPPDIIICDWHYTQRTDYPSIYYFQQKGFDVIPATWKDPQAALALLRASKRDSSEKMLGFMFTGWSAPPSKLLPLLLDKKPSPDTDGEARGVAEAIKLCISHLDAQAAAPEISIIPKPMQIARHQGQFELNWQTRIYANDKNPETKQVAEYLANLLRPATGFALPVHTCTGGMPFNMIFLTTGDFDSLGDEGYELEVRKDFVTIRASKPAGLFYGVQSLRQMLPPQIEKSKIVVTKKWTIPCAVITDKPRFGWRGSLLDSCRHFFSTDFVKRYIDLLAYHKLNVLHWHLTEDQGWRIEIKKYPRLTEIGAWRNTTSGNLRGRRQKQEKTDRIYGGYYTQDDIREIVEYAKSRYVMVVPEIEMPGHSTAALASYPHLACSDGATPISPDHPFKVKTTSGISRDVYCAGKEVTFEFLQDVLTEVLELFDSPYVHIGGDEAPKDRWKECPLCQERIKAENLKNEDELQTYFVRQIEKWLLERNRRLIGWDEIIQAETPGHWRENEIPYSADITDKSFSQKAIVQSWRGITGGIAAAKTGHDVIMSPTSHCYLDYPHTTTTIRKSYSFEPVPDGLAAEEQKHVLGGEGNVWTEHIRQETIDSWVFPRLTALSEVFWSPKDMRDFDDFSKRLFIQQMRFDIMGVDYSDGKSEKN